MEGTRYALALSLETRPNSSLYTVEIMLKILCGIRVSFSAGDMEHTKLVYPFALGDRDRGLWAQFGFEVTETHTSFVAEGTDPGSVMTGIMGIRWGVKENEVTLMAARELRQWNWILPLQSPTLVPPSTVSSRDSTSCTDNENNSVNSTEVRWGYFHPHRDEFYVQKPSRI